MSDENQKDAQPVDETVDTAPAPKKAKVTKTKAVQHRVLFTSPFGRPGDIVTVDPNDASVVHLVGNGGLEKV